jgi:hypothetical protein
LSRYNPFPGQGTVTKIKAGWPKLLCDKIDPPDIKPELDQLMCLNTILNTDVDIDYVRRWLITSSSLENPPTWNSEEFKNIVIESVRRKSKNFTYVTR